MLTAQKTVQDGHADDLASFNMNTNLVRTIGIGDTAFRDVHVDKPSLLGNLEGAPSDLIAIPKPGAIDQSTKLVLYLTRSPNSHHQAALLRTGTNDNLRSCQFNSISVNEKLKTYIILVNVAFWNLNNFELINSDLNGLASGVKTRATRKFSRWMLEFTLVSIVTETTNVLRLHGED